jgi:hypothetical protein
MLRAALVCFVVAACACSAEQVADPIGAAVTAGRAPDPEREPRGFAARPCRSDAFFIEVPLRFDTPWIAPSFVATLRTNLDAAANASGRPWFCGAGQTTCPSGAVGVAVERLLPERTTPALRADGHLRFYRVRYYDRTTRAILEVRPGAQCDAVRTLRDHVDAFIAVDQVYVGRECDASALVVEAFATDEMKGWHLDRLGLPREFDTARPDPGGRVADIALIDSGIDSRVASAIGVESSIDLTADPVLHPHGTAMATLMRQVAPQGALHSIRVLDRMGRARSGTFARGLDEALFRFPDRKTIPLVLNLSLGFPSELAAKAALEGEASCETWEDPAGESVRYELYLARRMEQDGIRRVFVSAAAGNQPGPVEPGLFPPSSEAPLESCPPQTLFGQSWFLPADWHRVDSCRISDPGPHRLALGVGAVDDRDRVSGIAIPDSESPLVGPGQHVYAFHRSATPPPASPVCMGSPPYPAPVTLPIAITGTSASAALASAVAARAQVARLSAGLSPFDRDVLARLLYLTGESVCEAAGAARVSPAGTAVRRLSARRMDVALASPACASLLSCAAAASDPEPIGTTLLDDCRHELVACGLESLDAMGNFVVHCASSSAVSWPLGYTPATCTSGSEPTSFVDAGSCPPSGCPYEAEPFRALLGSLGPEPDNGGCPECSVYIYASSASATLVLELNPKLAPGTQFLQPYLVVNGWSPTLGWKKYYLHLAGAAPSSAWYPGATLQLSIQLGGIPSDMWPTNTATVTLVSVLQSPGQQAATDYSPLRVF